MPFSAHNLKMVWHRGKIGKYIVQNLLLSCEARFTKSSVASYYLESAMFSKVWGLVYWREERGTEWGRWHFSTCVSLLCGVVLHTFKFSMPCHSV